MTAKQRRKAKNLVKRVAPVVAVPTRFSRNFLLISILLIIVAGFVSYANSLNGEFLYDDKNLVENNTIIQGPSGITKCFIQDVGMAGVGKTAFFYRPLQMAIYAINYRFFKLNVLSYHLINIFIHIGMALAICWFINILFSDGLLALFSALLYVVHPIHTEAVSYISGLADPLVGVFIILAMIIYIKQLEMPRFNIIGLSLLFASYACALLSKEYALVLPVLILFYHFVFNKRIKWPLFLFSLSPAIIYMLFRATVLKFTLPTESTPDTVFDRTPGFLIALSTYLKLLVLPFNLHMQYGSKLFEWTDPKVLLGFLVTAAVFIWGYFQRRNRIILFSLGWFFLGLLPVSNLYKINFFMTEHFLYVPSIGFFLIIAYFLSTLYQNPRYKNLGLRLFAVLMLFFLIRTIEQNAYWSNEIKFYERTIRLAPKDAVAYNNLGQIYENDNNAGKALYYYTKATQLDAHYPEAFNNLATVFEKKKKYPEAIANYTKAIELNPLFAGAYANRGNAYSEVNNAGKAIADYTKAIDVDPRNAQIYLSRGNAYSQIKNYAQAIMNYDKAIELRPNFVQAYFNRGNAYGNSGHEKEAIADFSKAIALKADTADAYNNRGYLYNKIGHSQEAMADLNQAINLDSNQGLYYINRAIVFDKLKEYQNAWDDVVKAQSLGSSVNPQFMEGLKQALGKG